MSRRRGARPRRWRIRAARFWRARRRLLSRGLRLVRLGLPVASTGLSFDGNWLRRDRATGGGLWSRRSRLTLTGCRRGRRVRFGLNWSRGGRRGLRRLGGDGWCHRRLTIWRGRGQSWRGCRNDDHGRFARRGRRARPDGRDGRGHTRLLLARLGRANRRGGDKDPCCANCRGQMQAESFEPRRHYLEPLLGDRSRAHRRRTP